MKTLKLKTIKDGVEKNVSLPKEKILNDISFRSKDFALIAVSNNLDKDKKVREVEYIVTIEDNIIVDKVVDTIVYKRKFLGETETRINSLNIREIIIYQNMLEDNKFFTKKNRLYIEETIEKYKKELKEIALSSDPNVRRTALSYRYARADNYGTDSYNYMEWRASKNQKKYRFRKQTKLTFSLTENKFK